MKPGGWIRAAVRQHISPKTIFEIVAAAIKEAEKMLRETKTVHEFNALFKHSRGLPSLLQKSQCPDRDNVISWRDNEYQKAKDAIEPSGNGLGRGFLAHFLPGDSLPKNDTLQSTITAVYQEEWKREGEKLMEQSRLARTSNAPRSGAARQTRQAKPSASRKHATHGGITQRKLGDCAGIKLCMCGELACSPNPAGLW